MSNTNTEMLLDVPATLVPPSRKRTPARAKPIKQYIPALFAIAIWRIPTQRVNIAPTSASRPTRTYQPTLRF